MLITVPSVLDGKTVAFFQQQLEATAWEDGSGSAGYLSRAVKNNAQLPDNHPVARKLGEIILNALEGSQLFISVALPAKILPPVFNRYTGGQSYGRHIDGAIRPLPGSPIRVRTDLSATLFLTPPEEYTGGELVIEDIYGPRAIKLGAGDLVLYPGNSVHRIEPVTKGVRLASFFWIQSMIRTDGQRTLLLQLDNAIQEIATETPGQKALTDLAGVYHNLLRLWSEI